MQTGYQQPGSGYPPGNDTIFNYHTRNHQVCTAGGNNQGSVEETMVGTRSNSSTNAPSRGRNLSSIKNNNVPSRDVENASRLKTELNNLNPYPRPRIKKAVKGHQEKVVIDRGMPEHSQEQLQQLSQEQLQQQINLLQQRQQMIQQQQHQQQYEMDDPTDASLEEDAQELDKEYGDPFGAEESELETRPMKGNMGSMPNYDGNVVAYHAEQQQSSLTELAETASVSYPLVPQLVPHEYRLFQQEKGIFDNNDRLSTEVKSVVRSVGWKWFKILNEHDMEYDSAFAKLILTELNLYPQNPMEDYKIKENWARIKKDVGEGMSGIRSSTTQKIQKAFTGKTWIS